MHIDIYYTIYCRFAAIMWTGYALICSAHRQQILLQRKSIFHCSVSSHFPQHRVGFIINDSLL